MAVVKYSKRPGRARKCEPATTFNGYPRDYQAAFCVALLALAVAGAPVGTALAQSMAGGAGTNPNATRTTLDPIPPEGGWDGLAKLLEAAKPGVDTRLAPSPRRSPRASRCC